MNPPAAHLAPCAGRIEAPGDSVPRDDGAMILGSHGVKTQRRSKARIDLGARLSRRDVQGDGSMRAGNTYVYHRGQIACATD